MRTTAFVLISALLFVGCGARSPAPGQGSNASSTPKQESPPANPPQSGKSAAQETAPPPATNRPGVGSEATGSALTPAPALAPPPKQREDYQPPNSIVPIQLQGTWQFGQLGPNTLAWYDPLTLDVAPGPGPQAVTVSVGNRRQQSLQLGSAVTFHLRICSVTRAGCSSDIWEGVLPPLTGTLAGNVGIASFSFNWDRHDSNGKVVPFGEYSVRLVGLPMTVPVRVGGANEQATLYADSHTQNSIFVSAGK